jgi:hypothetical protein
MILLMKPMSRIVAGIGTTISMTRSRVAIGRIAPRPALSQEPFFASSAMAQPPSRASII